jgi:hypothetical protein
MLDWEDGQGNGRTVVERHSLDVIGGEFIAARNLFECPPSALMRQI